MSEPFDPAPTNHAVEVCLPKLPAKQQQALLALLASASVREAAQRAHVSLRTLYRWLAEDARFQASYRSVRRQLMDQALGCLQDSVGKSVETLAQIAHTRMAPAASRVAACRALLEYGFKGDELAAVWHLEERVRHLEEALAAQKELINSLDHPKDPTSGQES